MQKKLKDKLNKNYYLKHYKKMWVYVKPYKKRALLMLLMSIPLGSLDAVIAWTLKPFMDNIVTNKSLHVATTIPFIIIGLAFLQAILNYFVGYLNSWVGVKITHNLKTEMYKELTYRESSFFDGTSSGEINIRYSADVDGACMGLLNHVKLFTTRIFSSIALMGVMFYHSWQLAIVAIAVLFVAFAPLLTFRKRIEDFTNKMVKQYGNIGNYYIESCVGNKTVASYNLQKLRIDAYKEDIRKIFKIFVKLTQRSAILPPIMTFTISVGIAVIIWYGSYLIINNSITSGEFVSFIASLIMLYNPVKSVGNNFAAIQSSLLAMERVFKLKETIPVIKNKKDAIKLENVKHSITFENVAFGYEKNKPILKNINLEIPVGKVYAFVGHSGGGKSSLVSLLPRFYDIISGSIKIDGNDTRDLTLESLRDNISIVLQDNFLFVGSIRYNITLGRDYSEDLINKAVESACLKEFIESLEHGLETEVGERGVLLSGGQKQRIAIARALLKDSPIVILDEATSALDSKSEKVVQRAISKLMKNRTVLVIAHRLSTIKNADKIVVIDNGEIVESGTHDELLKQNNGVYAALNTAKNEKV